MTRRPPRSTRTATHFPYTPLFRSASTDQCLRSVQFGLGKARIGAGDLNLSRKRAGLLCLHRPFNSRERLPRPHPITRLDEHAHNPRSEEHTSELQSLMRISYAVLCLTQQKQQNIEQLKHT